MEVLEYEIDTSPEIIADYAKLLIEMRSGKDLLVHIFGQPHARVLSIEDALVYYRLKRFIESGDLFFHRIFIGEGPKSNRSIKLNNAILSKIPPIYKAEFDGIGDYDGIAEWFVPITFETDPISICQDSINLDPRWAPLEVGSTDFETTFFHLLGTGILARWPYDDFNITIIHLPRAHQIYDEMNRR